MLEERRKSLFNYEKEKDFLNAEMSLSTGYYKDVTRGEVKRQVSSMDGKEPI